MEWKKYYNGKENGNFKYNFILEKIGKNVKLKSKLKFIFILH